MSAFQQTNIYQTLLTFFLYVNGTEKRLCITTFHQKKIEQFFNYLQKYSIILNDMNKTNTL